MVFAKSLGNFTSPKKNMAGAVGLFTIKSPGIFGFEGFVGGFCFITPGIRAGLWGGDPLE
jgi:hypothetical protein